MRISVRKWALTCLSDSSVSVVIIVFFNVCLCVHIHMCEWVHLVCVLIVIITLWYISSLKGDKHYYWNLCKVYRNFDIYSSWPYIGLWSITSVCVWSLYTHVAVPYVGIIFLDCTELQPVVMLYCVHTLHDKIIYYKNFSPDEGLF